MNKGRPIGTTIKKITFEKIDIDKFKSRVLNGQSLKMLSWEFKIPKPKVIQLCKQLDIPYNSWDSIRYSNKL